MADIRINSLPSTATSFNTDDYIAIDGASAGTRKMLASTLPLTDVTLGGASGPSVKSTLSARAPRQGLVYDGTTGSTGTLGSIPSGTWSVSAVIDVPTSNPASNIMALTMGNGYGVAGGGSFVFGDITTSGDLNVSQWAGTFPAYRLASISGFRAANSGKRVHLAAVVTGAALTIYINGVATSYTETSGAGAPAWGATLASANVFVGKGQSSLYYFSGGIYAPLIYNRALSAAEVVALYEAGAPSGADYNSASNTAFNTSNFVEAIAYTTFTGVSATGFSATQTGAVTSLVVTKPNITINAGNRVLVTFTGTLTSGAVPNVALVTSANGVASNISAVAAGSNSVILTATAPCVGVGFYTTGAATSYAISNVVATRLGLLLAPDAAQAGGGLTWYDTSGNAANITLPASGVSWNVPSSGYWGGNLTVSGTGGISIGSATFTGGRALTATTGSGNNVGLRLLQTSVADWEIKNVATTGALSFAQSATEYARLTATGNFLLKSDGVDSGNGKLQLADHTTSAGGIGFGTEVSLYRQNTGTLRLENSTGGCVFAVNGNSGNTRAVIFYGSGTEQAAVRVDGGNTSLELCTGASRTIALTLDSSQNFKLTPAVVSTINTTQSAPQIRMGSRASGRSNVVLDSTAGRVWSLENTGTSLTVGYSGLDAITVAETTGNTTFAGSIAIGNTVQTAVAVASTHKVTISIGGSTYYLLATNV